MQQSEIIKITEALRKHCNLIGSQNKAAKSLGISTAQVSYILNGKTDGVTDAFWRLLSAKLGLSAEGEQPWVVSQTQAYKQVIFCVSYAQESSQTMAMTGSAGLGKTKAIDVYCSEHPHAYHLCCSEYWNRKTFLAELLKCMGVDFGGYSVPEMVEDVINCLKSKDHPLIIMDEADKLSDSVLYFFISIYNRLEDRCGLMLVATDYLEKRIMKGLRTNKKGYQEIYSRLGRKFIKLPALTDEDIIEVCSANGMTDPKAIKRLLQDLKNDSQIDLRRVKRVVLSTLEQMRSEQKEVNDEQGADD